MKRERYIVPGFYERMLTLAIPIALQNMLASCAGLVDTAMVARLGNVATSAVGIGGKWSFVLQMITFGFCSGGSVLISQYWGAQDHKGVRRAYSLGMGLCLIVAVLYNIAAALFPYEMMCLFTDEEAVRLAGAEYLGIVCWGAVPLAFATIASMARRCVEDVRTPLLISGVSVCINTFFNWCLIYGKCGLPQLGLRGAAVATVLSHVVQAALVIFIGVRQKHFTIYGLNEVLKIPSDFIKKYFHIALPVIGNETLWCVGFNIYAIVYAHQGSENYAAYTLYSSIENLVFVFFVGACNACSIMIGKSIGQGLW
ncbi:MAG: MATE family efflux transporter, partial [Clostridia bacterium]|nr:MATE family efflux transporter [Clostridia bacterium]